MDAFWKGIEEKARALRSGDAAQSGRLEAAAQAATEATGEALGACPSNTPPISSQISLQGFPEYKTTLGIDWLEYGGVLPWPDEPFEKVMAQLEAAKVQCQSLEQDEMRVLLNGCEAVYLQRIGMKRGKGGGFFDYRFIYKGIPICLAQRRSIPGEVANVFVQMRGNECLLHGGAQGHAVVNDLLTRLGAGPIQDEKISRVDLRLDVAGLPVTVIKNLIATRCFVTRSRYVQEWENKATNVWTGVTVGKHPRELRIYDKKRQQLRKYDAEIFQTLVDRCWGGLDPEFATRIEYQLGRNYLKFYQINSLADLQSQLGSLLAQLTTEFFRFTSVPIISSEKHQSRAEIHPLWSAIQAAVREHAQVPAQKLVPIRYEQVNPRKLIAQGVGCLVAAMLQRNQVFANFGQFLEMVIAMVREHFHDEHLKLRFLTRYWQRFKDKAYDFSSAA